MKTIKEKVEAFGLGKALAYMDSDNEFSLLEALKSPLFMECRKGQPFNKNHLRPCPLLDNQGALAGMVKRSDVHSTDMASPEDVDSLTAKCKDAADKWEVTSDRIWINSPASKKA